MNSIAKRKREGEWSRKKKFWDEFTNNCIKVLLQIITALNNWDELFLWKDRIFNNNYVFFILFYTYKL